LSHIDRKRFDVSVFCVESAWTGSPLLARLREAGLRLFDMDIRRRLYGAHALRQIARLARFLRRERVDILHTYLPESNIVGALARLLSGSRTFVASQRSMWSFVPPNKRLASKIAYRIADWIHVNSADYQDSIQAVMHVPDSKFLLIHNGIDLEEFDTAGDRDRVRRELGIKDHERVVGMVAGMQYAIKGHDVFLRAARAIAHRTSDVRFMLIGDGPRRRAIEAHGRELGLERQLMFLGYRTDVPRLLASMDVFLQCQTYTGGSNAVLEAMAASRAVVATSASRDNEVVDGTCGYVVRPGDDGALAERTLELLEDPALATRFGKHAYLRVHAEFTIARMVRAFEEFYASV
jgi:glycosyltransferase involved in cell wall biosynthesis